MKKEKAIIFLSLALVCIMLPHNCIARKKSINDFTEQAISGWQRLVYDITDFFIFEELGYLDVSPETEHYIRQIQKELGMEHITIRLRNMSRNAIFFAGRENGLTIPVPYANTIIICEEWFNSLTEQEKKALIGHELIHIRNKHSYKKIGLFIVTDLALRKVKFLPNLIINLIITQLYSRAKELEADQVAAQELNNIDGSIELMHYFKDLKDPYSRFLIKRVIQKTMRIISRPIRKIFRSEPSFSQRIKGLQKLGEQ